MSGTENADAETTNDENKTMKLSDYIGESYDYVGNINGPIELKMGVNKTMNENVDGIYQYVSLLTDGVSKASDKTINGSKPYGLPLGNKQFLTTFAKCVDIDTNTKVNRYMYMNNVPSGTIAGIDIGMYGLIPGLIENVGGIVPGGLVKELAYGEDVPCKKVKLEVIDSENNVSFEEHHVALAELQQLANNNQLRDSGTVENTGKSYDFKAGKTRYTKKQVEEWIKNAPSGGGGGSNKDKKESMSLLESMQHSVGTVSEMKERDHSTLYSGYSKEKGYRQGDMLEQMLYLGDEHDKEQEKKRTILGNFDVSQPDGLMKVYLLGFVVLCSYMSMRMVYR